MRTILLCLLLTGCATPQERLAAVGLNCEALGFERGTEPFAQCQLQTWQGVEAQNAANFRFLMQQQQMNRPVTCTRIGYTTTCN